MHALNEGSPWQGDDSGGVSPAASSERNARMTPHSASRSWTPGAERQGAARYPQRRSGRAGREQG